jgi:hypothetical protein
MNKIVLTDTYEEGTVAGPITRNSLKAHAK